MKLNPLLLYTHCLLATASLLPQNVPAAPPDCRKAAGAQRNAANTACENRPESERYECKRDALRIYRVEIARCPLDPNKDLCDQRAENNAALRTEECYRLEGTPLNRCTKEALRLERIEKSQCPAPDTYTVNRDQPRLQTYSCYKVIRRARDVDRRRCDCKNNPGKCRRRQDETYKIRLGQCAKKARLEVARERDCYEHEIDIFEAGMAKCESESFARQKTAEKAAQTEYDNWPGHATYKHLYANFEKARDRYNEAEKRFIEVNNTHIRALQECSKLGNKDEYDACVAAALKPVNAARADRDEKKKLQENAAKREAEFRPQNVAAREKMEAAKQATYKAGAEERRKCK